MMKKLMGQDEDPLLITVMGKTDWTWGKLIYCQLKQIWSTRNKSKTKTHPPAPFPRLNLTPSIPTPLPPPWDGEQVLEVSTAAPSSSQVPVAPLWSSKACWWYLLHHGPLHRLQVAPALLSGAPPCPLPSLTLDFSFLFLISLHSPPIPLPLWLFCPLFNIFSQRHHQQH